MRFRLVIYATLSDNKYDAEQRHEYLGDRDAIWYLWYSFTKVAGYKHVEVYSLDGTRQEPEKGINGMSGYNV